MFAGLRGAAAVNQAFGNLKPGDIITAKHLNTMADLLRMALNITGPDVMQTATGTHIRRAPLPPQPFLAKITSSASLATNRWKYAWSEVVLDRTDDGFDIRGRSGTTTTDYALNTVEAFNDGTGVQAPGVDIDGADYPAGFALMAIQGDPVVMMYPIPDDEGRLRYFFSLANAHDGECE